MSGSEDGKERDAAAEAVCRLLCGVFDCPLELAGHILLRGRLCDFDGRATIVRRGDRISTLYVIVAGRAHAIVYSLDGQMVLLHEYRSGDFFGVVSPPYSATHDADVVAVEQVSAFLLEGSVLALLAEQHACIGLALLKVMVERLQQTASRMYEHVALSAVGRVHAELLRQARQSEDLAIRPEPGRLRSRVARIDHARNRVARGQRARAARHHPARRRRAGRGGAAPARGADPMKLRRSPERVEADRRAAVERGLELADPVGFARRAAGRGEHGREIVRDADRVGRDRAGDRLGRSRRPLPVGRSAAVNGSRTQAISP